MCALVLCQPECVAAYLHFLLSRYNHLLKSLATLIGHLHGSPFRDMSFALAKDIPYRTLTASVLRSFCYHLYVLLCSLFSTTGGAGTAAVGGRLEAAKNRHGSNPYPMPFSFLPSGTEEEVMLNVSQESNGYWEDLPCTSHQHPSKKSYCVKEHSTARAI